MVGHGGSSAGSYLADPTSAIPSHCASIVMTSTLRVNCYVHVWEKVDNQFPCGKIVSKVSKVAFIILSYFTIEASHSGFMRQFELYAIIYPTYSTHARCCMPNEW